MDTKELEAVCAALNILIWKDKTGWTPENWAAELAGDGIEVCWQSGPAWFKPALGKGPAAVRRARRISEKPQPTGKPVKPKKPTPSATEETKIPMPVARMVQSKST